MNNVKGKNNYIAQAWLVLLLAFAFGAGLAGVQAALKSRIDANKAAETQSQIPLLVPAAETGGEAKSFGDLMAYPAQTADGRTVGWVVPARGQGFADVIELLLGLNADAAEITGVYVLDQKETPGLGNKITEEAWRGQFAGKSTAGPLTVVKRPPQNDREIEAVTGATISSDSVTEIVNKTARQFRAALQEKR